MEHVIHIPTRENEKLNALMQLAYDITHKGGQLNAESKAAFYQQGYTDENLVDLLLQISNNTADETSAQSENNLFRFFAGIFTRMPGGAARRRMMKH
jgi:hypothetical protein